jgi:hypothetical protein
MKIALACVLGLVGFLLTVAALLNDSTLAMYVIGVWLGQISTAIFAWDARRHGPGVGA